MDTKNVVESMYKCKTSLLHIYVSRVFPFSNNLDDSVKSLLLTEFIICDSSIIIIGYNNKYLYLIFKLFVYIQSRVTYLSME